MLTAEMGNLIHTRFLSMSSGAAAPETFEAPPRQVALFDNAALTADGLDRRPYSRTQIESVKASSGWGSR